MSKGIFYIILTVLLVVGAGYLLLGKNVENNNQAGNAVNVDGGVQKVTLSIKNYNYYPNTVKVQAGKPVRIYLDETVSGCLRSFTIRDFGIAKYLPTPNDYIEFTPAKPGTHAFACSMGMGTGTLIVE